MKLLQRLRNIFGKPQPQPAPALPVSAAGQTDVGLQREHNEDVFGVSPEGELVVVADGMGGHNAGEVASALAVESLMACLSPEGLPTAGGDPEEVAALIKDCVLKAHQRILDKAASDKDCAGMGSTVVLALRRGPALHLCNVGDSRAYIMDRHGIRLLSRDHSMVMDLVDSGSMTMAEARVSKLKNRLTQALGSPNPITPNCLRLDLPQEGWLLLCSDGLWDMLSDERMLEIARERQAPQDVCAALIAEANQQGGEDNITAAVMRFGASPQVARKGQTESLSQEEGPPA